MYKVSECPLHGVVKEVALLRLRVRAQPEASGRIQSREKEVGHWAWPAAWTWPREEWEKQEQKKGEDKRGGEERGTKERSPKGCMAETTRFYGKSKLEEEIPWTGKVRWRGKELRATGTDGDQHVLCMLIWTRVRPHNLYTLLCCLIFNQLIYYQPHCWV